MYQDASVWRVIDYKTDVELTTHAASYQQQLKMYENALSSVGIVQTASQVHPVRIKPEESTA